MEISEIGMSDVKPTENQLELKNKEKKLQATDFCKRPPRLGDKIVSNRIVFLIKSHYRTTREVERINPNCSEDSSM